MNTEAFKKALLQYCPEEECDDKYRLDICSFVDRQPTSWWSRTTREGHVTASAWVLNSAATHVLLLHHAKLNRWLQPGGHLDDTDTSTAAGALREAFEESGLADLRLANEAIFDLDIHPIPARGEEPAHLHYDVRYLVFAPSDAVSLSSESLGFRWLPVQSIIREGFEESLQRLARRTAKLNLPVR